jgi:hypothetical protein
MKTLLAATIFALTLMASASGQAQALSCEDYLAPLENVESWMHLIEKATHSYLPAEKMSVEQLQSTKSFKDLEKYLGELSKRPDSIRPRHLKKLVAKLYVVSNDPLNRIVPVKELDKDSVGTAIHEKLLKRMMQEDLVSALDEATAWKPAKSATLRNYLQERSRAIRVTFWTVIHVPMILFGQYYPMYLPDIENFKLTPEVDAMVRERLDAGDFNSALRLVEPELQKIYGRAKQFDKFYGITRKLYRTMSSVMLAHAMLTSGVAEHYVPELSQTYQSVVSPVRAAIERQFTDRRALEETTIRAVIEQKEDVVGHKIEVGSPEYNKTVAHVRALDLDAVRAIASSLGR